MTYQIPYKTTGKRPVGLAPQGYVRVEAENLALAITKAKQLIGVPHILEVGKAVEQ